MPSGAPITLLALSKMLKVDRSTIQRWIYAGHLSAMKNPGPKGQWRIPRREVTRIRRGAGAFSQKASHGRA
jgi:excisionase family DNA binding protein